MDTLHLRKKRGAEGRGEANAGESVLTRGAEEDGGVIVVVCAAFSLTVSEANCYKWWS